MKKEDFLNMINVEMWDEDIDGEGNADWVGYWNEEEEMDFDEFADKYLPYE